MFFFPSRSMMASTHLKGKLRSSLWKISLVADWFWGAKKMVYGTAHSHERLLQTCLGWKQDEAHHAARWDLHHLKGTVPKILLGPGWLCPGLASVLPGSVAQSCKLSCSSEVSSASTPRSKQNPQRSLLQYFSSPIKGILIDIFTSHHRVRTRGPYIGIKRVLFMKRCAGVASLLFGRPPHDTASFLKLWDKSLTWV